MWKHRAQCLRSQPSSIQSQRGAPTPQVPSHLSAIGQRTASPAPGLLVGCPQWHLQDPRPLPTTLSWPQTHTVHTQSEREDEMATETQTQCALSVARILVAVPLLSSQVREREREQPVTSPWPLLPEIAVCLRAGSKSLPPLGQQQGRPPAQAYRLHAVCVGPIYG